MRVVLSYGEKLTIKVKLPKKWLSGPTETLKTTLVDNFNTKHPDEVIVATDYHLELDDGTILCSDDIVQKQIPDRATLQLVAGASPTMAESAAEARRAADAAKPVEDPNDPTLTCRNFGCQKKYRESENHDAFCCYHKSPPVFHETAKYWSCCPDKKAYDWDTFMAIKGCQSGRCTTQKPGQSVLGGSDVRAAAQAQNDYTPQRVDTKDQSGSAPNAPAALNKGRLVTPLDKLSALRKAVVGIGVDGVQFDSARDTIKTRYEELGKDVWKKVSEEMAAAFTEVLEKMEMQTESH
jgi:hypothetical protein